jgi:hypothetical protein
MMKSYFEKSLSYTEYIALIDSLLAEGKSTGPDQTESRLEFSKLNRHRMNRVAKTIDFSESLKRALHENKRPMIWLVITEGWCGDAAQIVPAIERIAAESENIEARYLLRDENPELMDQYLTNGARAIPMLIAVDAVTFEPIGQWGPRPTAGTEYFQKMKAEGVEKSMLSEMMQRWYNDDKTRSIQADFEGLLRLWNAPRTSVAGNGN